MRIKKPYFWATVAPLGVALVFSLFILIFFKSLPPKLPLFYSLPWGEGQLAIHLQFFTIPTILILITLLNFAILWYLHPSQVFFKKVLAVASLLITLIFTVTFAKIVYIFI